MADGGSVTLTGVKKLLSPIRAVKVSSWKLGSFAEEVRHEFTPNNNVYTQLDVSSLCLYLTTNFLSK